MKKKLLSLVLALSLCPPALAANGTLTASDEKNPALQASGSQKENTETEGLDFSRYVTGKPLTKEDLTVGGVPFYQQTCEEIFAILPKLEHTSTYSLYTEQGPDGTERLIGYYETFSQTGERTVHTCISVRRFAGNSMPYTVYYIANKPVRGEIARIATEVRGITTGEPLESVLQKVGVSAEGAPIIASELINGHTNFFLPGGTVSGSSFENSYDENGNPYDAPTIRWCSEDGHFSLTLIFRNGLLNSLTMSDDTTDPSSLPRAADLDSETPSFSDVPADAYYKDAVAWAVTNGITKGTGDGTTFSPTQPCTTGQILTFLFRANHSPVPEATAANGFTDNAALSEEFRHAGQWAAAHHLLQEPVDSSTPCSRGDVVIYLWILAGKPEAPLGPAQIFTDIGDLSAENTLAQAVAWALNKKFASGTSSSSFSPEASCTRGQIAAFLFRAFGA